MEQSTRKTIKHKRQLDAYAPGLSLQTYQPISNIDKLHVSADSWGVGMFPSLYSFIQKCYRLQEQQFSVSILQPFCGYTHSSSQRLHIYESEIHASILHSLSTSYQNLKELRLYDITTFADMTLERKKIVVDLQDMTL